MKKILILYGSYGGGHLSAANSISDYILQNYKDVQVDVVDCIKFIDKFFNKVSTKAYSEIAKKAPWAWGKVYYGAESRLYRKNL